MGPLSLSEQSLSSRTTQWRVFTPGFKSRSTIYTRRWCERLSWEN